MSLRAAHALGGKADGSTDVEKSRAFANAAKRPSLQKSLQSPKTAMRPRDPHGSDDRSSGTMMNIAPEFPRRAISMLLFGGQ